MNLKDCYIKFGGNLDEVLGRPRREQAVQKFVHKFLDDKSLSLFEASMDNKSYAEALRTIHILKGICQDLFSTRLFESSSLATIVLKGDDWNKVLDTMPQLSKGYHAIINAIEELKIFKEE